MGVEVKEWKAPDKLAVPPNLKKAGMGYKFVSPKRLEQRKQEGWEPVSAGGKVTWKPGHIASTIEGVCRVRELILCEMPLHMVKQRNDHWQKKADRNMAAVSRGTKVKNEAKSANREAQAALGADKDHIKSFGKTTISAPPPDKAAAEDIQVEKDLRMVEGDS